MRTHGWHMSHALFDKAVKQRDACAASSEMESHPGAPTCPWGCTLTRPAERRRHGTQQQQVRLDGAAGPPGLCQQHAQARQPEQPQARRQRHELLPAAMHGGRRPLQHARCVLEHSWLAQHEACCSSWRQRGRNRLGLLLVVPLLLLVRLATCATCATCSAA